MQCDVPLNDKIYSHNFQSDLKSNTMKYRGRPISRKISVYDDLHTNLANYDEYKRRGYHKSIDDDSEEEELDIDPRELARCNAERAEQKSEHRR